MIGGSTISLYKFMIKKKTASSKLLKHMPFPDSYFMAHVHERKSDLADKLDRRGQNPSMHYAFTIFFFQTSPHSLTPSHDKDAVEGFPERGTAAPGGQAGGGSTKTTAEKIHGGGGGVKGGSRGDGPNYLCRVRGRQVRDAAFHLLDYTNCPQSTNWTSTLQWLRETADVWWHHVWVTVRLGCFVCIMSALLSESSGKKHYIIFGGRDSLSTVTKATQHLPGCGAGHLNFLDTVAKRGSSNTCHNATCTPSRQRYQRCFSSSLICTIIISRSLLQRSKGRTHFMKFQIHHEGHEEEKLKSVGFRELRWRRK